MSAVLVAIVVLVGGVIVALLLRLGQAPRVQRPSDETKPPPPPGM